MIDRDFDEASAWNDLVTTDSGVSVEAECAYLLGEGPDPWPNRVATPAEETWLRAIDAGPEGRR